MSFENFKTRITEDFAPTFGNYPDRLYGTRGFTRNFDEVGSIDAENFLRAFDVDLIRLDDKLYKAPRTKDGEQLFWEYDKADLPRRYSLSIEVVITIATLAVLHLDFGWPKECLGTQSLHPHPGAIDVVSYIDGHSPDMVIACEIKKKRRNVAKLIDDMRNIGSALPAEIPKSTSATTHRKVAALRHWRPPIFWALGPDNDGSVFEMTYFDDGRMAFEPAALAALRYSGPLAPTIHPD